jgi:cobalamin biosynthesis protein CobD/CbiB
MSFFSLVGVLLLEHFHPLTHRIQLYVQFARYANFLERHLNGGRYRYGVLAWTLAVLPPALAVGIACYLLRSANPLLGLLFNVGVLYVTLGIKHFGDTANHIAHALRSGNVDDAQKSLNEWQGGGAQGLSANAIARLGIERLFVCAHRQFFGVFLWFVLLGPAGAVIYRFAHILYQKWGVLDPHEFGRFGMFSARVFELLDWIPVRLLGLSFAVVGDFEDAIHCWREQAANWTNKVQGIVLAAGAGALGVRLGEPLEYEGKIDIRPELGLGDEADADHVDSAVSLVWRTVALWLAVLLLMTLARWAAQ